jgi:hypothetical protein
MPVIGKEQERQLTPEEIAASKVEGYIERVEKQTEISGDVAKYVQPQGQVTLPKPVTDDYGKVIMESAHAEEAPITLPLTEVELRDGLHHKVIDSVRWLAERCVYLIKKYPGRVFYSKE